MNKNAENALAKLLAHMRVATALQKVRDIAAGKDGRP